MSKSVVGKGRSTRRIAGVAAVGAAAMLATLLPSTPAGAAPAKGNPIKIPLLVELSGAVAPTGRAVLAGAQTAEYVINQNGGINGRPIELVVTDTQSNATVTASAIRTTLSSKPVAIMSALATAALTPSVPVVAAANTPWVITGPLFNGIDKVPYLFSGASDNQSNATVTWEAVKFALGGASKVKGKTIYAVAPTPSAANDERMQFFKSMIKKDGATVVIDREPIAMTSFTSQAATILRLNPAAVVNFHIDSPGLTIAKALDVAGWDGPIISGTEANSDIVLSSVVRTNFYAVRESIAPAAGSPLFNAVVAAKASTTRYLSNIGNSGRAYATLWTLAKALDKCGLPCPAAKFATTMHGLGTVAPPNNPLLGGLNFSKGNAGLRTMQLWKWDKTAKKAVPLGAPIAI